MSNIFNYKNYHYCYTPSVVTKHNYIISDNMGYSKSHDFDFNRETFDSHIIIYILDGTFYVEQYGIKYTLHRGDSILMTLRDKHHYYSDSISGAEFIWMHFSGAPTENIINKLKNNNMLPIISKDVYIKENIIKCFQLSYYKKNTYQYDTSAIIYSVVMSVCSKSLYNIENKLENVRDESSEIYKFVLSMIYDKIITIEDFCKHFGMGKTKLFQYVYSQLGIQPMKYVQEVKINEIKKLLLTTDYSLDEISQKLLFSDQSHMTRIFKKSVGITPLKYKYNFI